MNSCVRKCVHGGTSIYNYEILTPIGSLEVEACFIGLHKLKFKEVLREEVFSNVSKKKNRFLVKENCSLECVKLVDNHLTCNKEVILPLLDYLNYFFSYCLNQSNYVSYIKKNNEISSICWSSVCAKDSFTEKVLKALCNQTIGSTITYKNLGLLAGNQNAQRAVGSVMRKNPICLIIPCHRVIKSGDNNIGNYSGGVEIKEWLLRYEKNFIKD